MKYAISPSKVHNAGDRILSLADLSGDSIPNIERLRRTYEQSYWYACGRMDEAIGRHSSHAEADLFARARATAHHRRMIGEAVSTDAMKDDFDAAWRPAHEIFADHKAAADA